MNECHAWEIVFAGFAVLLIVLIAILVGLCVVVFGLIISKRCVGYLHYKLEQNKDPIVIN